MVCSDLAVRKAGAGAGGTRDVNERRSLRFEIVPAGGTNAANYLEREIRHILVL
jgi:hypothetical protein